MSAAFRRPAHGYRESGGPPASLTLTVGNTPDNSLALNNLAFCNPKQASSFEQGLALVSSPSGISAVFTVQSHQSLEEGTLALNLIQRKYLKVSQRDLIKVSSFRPPDVGFKLIVLTFEVDFVKGRGKAEELDAVVFGKHIQKMFINQVFTVGQLLLLEFMGTHYILSVSQTVVDEQPDAETATRGMLVKATSFFFESTPTSGIKFANQRGGTNSNLFKQRDFNFQKLGIGGLDAEFQDIFRRAFASRVFPVHVIRKLGINPVKGLLLWGPPGTGKTLIARQIGKMLNGREPKVVNGPEVLSKFVGETEKNIRDLFADAESDQKSRGDQSDLHIIIFDEIDAICKTRGSTRDGTGVHDSIVNQLLTKIDGVEALNNILLIGMTNRKDLLDEALLRPGRFEVQIEIGLPDEKGRVQILQIHSSKMKENSFLAPDVNLEELAARTKNFSGAELEGLVKSAVSFALNRQINLEDLSKPLDEDNIKIGMDDFLHALQEVKPAFGAAMNSLEMCRLNGMLDCGDRHRHIQESLMTLVEQVKGSERNPLLACLLEGPRGSGKTAMAATVAIDSEFPFIKIVSAENMVGYSESSKCSTITKVFEDAYKSPLSIIILDDIERLLEYVNIGPRFSNLILQTLLVLLKRIPPKGRRLLIIGTTGAADVLNEMGMIDVFNKNLHVPELKGADIKKVLKDLNVFTEVDLEAAVTALHQLSIKKLLMVVDMAAQGKFKEHAEAVYSGQRKIDINTFYDCLSDLT
eukprot:c15654_g1_i1 orf=195-2447(+)